MRNDAPDAHILYKPHPDVEAGHRIGGVDDQLCLELADEIVRDEPISALIDLVDEVSKGLDTGVLGTAPVFHKCDLTDTPSLEKTLAEILKDGPVTILLNNAARDDRHTLSEVTSEFFDKNVAVNLKHLAMCSRVIAPGMKAAGGRGRRMCRTSWGWERRARSRDNRCPPPRRSCVLSATGFGRGCVKA